MCRGEREDARKHTLGGSAGLVVRRCSLLLWKQREWAEDPRETTEWDCKKTSGRSSGCISSAEGVASLICPCVYLIRRKYWGKKGRGRAGLAKMCELLTNLVDSAEVVRFQLSYQKCSKEGRLPGYGRTAGCRNWERREEGDPDSDLISGNSLQGSCKCIHVTHVNQSLDTWPLGRRNNMCQGQLTAR